MHFSNGCMIRNTVACYSRAVRRSATWHDTITVRLITRQLTACNFTIILGRCPTITHKSTHMLTAIFWSIDLLISSHNRQGRGNFKRRPFKQKKWHLCFFTSCSLIAIKIDLNSVRLEYLFLYDVFFYFTFSNHYGACITVTLTFGPNVTTTQIYS